MRWLYYFSIFIFCANLSSAQGDVDFHSIDEKGADKKKPYKEPEPPLLGEVFKPKIALGTGMLSYFGDLYSKHYQAPWTARVGADLNISHRLNRYLQINFNVMFGKLGAFENTLNRHENFQSEIRAGGLNLMYDFGNFIPDQYKIRPWISAGVTGFEFLSKTDLKDKNGETYYYWTDGSIKNMAEGSAGSQNAKDLVKDYVYETDIRERNADGFGKYQERAWAFPVGFGALMQVTDRLDFKIGVQYYFTTTDYIDGVTNKSVGNRAGTKGKDKFVYSSFALQYDLVFNGKSPKDTTPDGYYDGIDWLAIDNGDYDKDGVRDFDDKCQGTPPGVKVDVFGCPLDTDGDLVPDYMDDENPSPKGFEVNMHGVALTDEFWQNWYDRYMDDSVGVDRTTEIIGNGYAVGPKKININTEDRTYTIELARYKGGVPSDEMALLLSIGDIRSTTLDDGTTVVYTAGTYNSILQAVSRRDEFISEGNKSAKVGYFKGGENKYSTLSDQELATLVKEEKEGGLKGNTAITNNSGTNIKGNINISGNDNAGNNTAGNNSNTGNNTSGNNNSTGNNNTSGNNNSTGNNNTAGNNTSGNNNSTGNNGTAGNNNTSGNNTSGNNNATNENSGNNASADNTFVKGDVVYRVQLGAYKNRISDNVFKNVGVIELKTEDNYYRYVTNGSKTIEKAAALRADLVLMGYTDAFVTAYKGGKRVAMNTTGAHVENKQHVEDLNENKAFSSVDKSLVSFKIQLGALKKPGSSNDMEDRIKDLPGVENQGTSTGMIRYSYGNYKEYLAAEKARKELEDKGFPEAFIIATFKNEIISIQEAMELLK